VQRGQLPGFLVHDEAGQLVRQLDLLRFKALAGELHAGAMSKAEVLQVGLEQPVRIGGPCP
jgi:hypothetical protein